MSTDGVMAGRPADGTGEVVIIRTESPTADVWTATWQDDADRIVIGPSDASLEECMEWAWDEAKPSEIRIITSNPTQPGPRLILHHST